MLRALREAGFVTAILRTDRRKCSLRRSAPPGSRRCSTRALGRRGPRLQDPSQRLQPRLDALASRARGSFQSPTPGTPMRPPISECGSSGATAMASGPRRSPGRPDFEIRTLAELPAPPDASLAQEPAIVWNPCSDVISRRREAASQGLAAGDRIWRSFAGITVGPAVACDSTSKADGVPRTL